MPDLSLPGYYFPSALPMNSTRCLSKRLVWSRPESWLIRTILQPGNSFLHGSWRFLPSGTLWWTYKKLLKMAIEIVDFPIKNGGSFHSKMLVHQRVNVNSLLCFKWPSRNSYDLPIHSMVDLSIAKCNSLPKGRWYHCILLMVICPHQLHPQHFSIGFFRCQRVIIFLNFFTGAVVSLKKNTWPSKTEACSLL